MKITTLITFDIETWEVIDHEFYEYEGPVDELKKGRDIEKKSAELGLDQQKKDVAEENQISGVLTPFDESLIADASKPGSLSPYAQAQYGSDLENVDNTYRNLQQQGFKLLGASGFGNAPSGRESSMENTLLNDEGQAQTAAYRTAEANTLNEGLAGGSQLENEQSIMNPVNEQNATQTGAYNLNKMGSTAGDVLTGISDAAMLAAAIPTGGASLLGLGAQQAAKAAGGGAAASPAQIPASYGGTAPETVAAASPTAAPPSIPTPGAAASPSTGSNPLALYAPPPDLNAVSPVSSTITPSASTAKNGFQRLSA